MILNSNDLRKISKKMIIEICPFDIDKKNWKTECALYLYFDIDNELYFGLNEELKKSMKESIQSFDSIESCGRIKNDAEKTKHIIFQSQISREFLIKELYATGIVCQYPTFLKINDSYYFINELSFIKHDKDSATQLLFEKYDQIDRFIIENLYGIDQIKTKGYKRDGKEYKKSECV